MDQGPKLTGYNGEKIIRTNDTVVSQDTRIIHTSRVVELFFCCNFDSENRESLFLYAYVRGETQAKGVLQGKG